VKEPETFNPNQVTFDEGLERIRDAAQRSGLSRGRGVITSRDAEAQEAQTLLTVSNVPGGFRKWQLPIYLDRPSQLFITEADPNLLVPEHSHDEGDGIRFIAGGSIIFNGMELTAGDWMFVPAGARYSFKTGAMGALMCYCYCCCCAGRRDLFTDRGDPAPMVGP
jgi:hypothetical protein